LGIKKVHVTIDCEPFSFILSPSTAGHPPTRKRIDTMATTLLTLFGSLMLLLGALWWVLRP
jgi:hypothetical protein